MAKGGRLYSASRSVHARNIMLATPDAALQWMLSTLRDTQLEVQQKMIKEGRIPDAEHAPNIVLTFDVYGVPADVKEQVNGQDLGH